MAKRRLYVCELVPEREERRVIGIGGSMIGQGQFKRGGMAGERASGTGGFPPEKKEKIYLLSELLS